MKWRMAEHDYASVIGRCRRDCTVMLGVVLGWLAIVVASSVAAMAAAPTIHDGPRIQSDQLLRFAQAQTRKVQAPIVKRSVTIIYEEPKCPPTMERDDEGTCRCVGDTTWNPRKKRCERIVVTEFVCPEGSTKVGKKCIRCPSGQYLYQGTCQCPEPLLKKGNRCEEEKVAECLPPKYVNDEGKCVSKKITVVNCLPPMRKWMVNGQATCIQPPQITITPQELPGGEENSDEYPASQLVANGGARPYAFTLTSGQLPPGLKLGDYGSIQGVPSKAGAYAFTVTATDAQQFQGRWNYSITITKPKEEEVASTECPQGTMRLGPDCVPVAGTVICSDEEDMRNGRCVKRPPEIVLYPRQVQTQLKRIGCLTGRVDGNWGSGSRAALRKFYRRARTRTRNLEPTKAALNAASSKRQGFCPGVVKRPKPPKKPPTKWKPPKVSGGRPCGYAQFRRNGRCVCAGGLRMVRGRCVNPTPGPTFTITIGGGRKKPKRDCWTDDEGRRRCD